MVKKSKKKESVKVKEHSGRDLSLVEFVKDCNQAGKTYRDKFSPDWTAIESQIRCQHPDDWEDKEDWQSKVFIPQQSKISETAGAYLDKILFGQPMFFDIQGVEKRDKEKEGYLSELFLTLLNRGDFYSENDFILKEGVDIGTSFLKMTVAPDRMGLRFTWRSPFYLKFDPSCGHNFYNAKWIIDEYPKTLGEIIDSVNSPYPIYTKERVEAMLEMMHSEVNQVMESDGEKAIAQIKSFDGTEMLIPQKYMSVNISEFWGKVKVDIETDIDGDKGKKKTIKSFKYEDRIVAVVNDKFVLRDDPNDYGFNPFFILRTKTRKYDTYGLGFCHNSMDLQDLMNSMVNLGFDSLKICSMDIVMIDETQVKDKSSIEYKPLAVWRFKGNPNQAVSMTRQGMSALGEIIRGITVLDQFQQEASGVLRQIQGAEAGGSSTLGEYQAKLAMADNRFLKVARTIEKDYIIRVVKGMHKIVFNPKFFNQRMIDRLLGVKEEEVEIPTLDGGVETVVNESPKLDFNEIVKMSDFGFDFKATGMTQFVSRLENLQKMKELLIETVKTPQLMIISKIDEIYKRTLQAAEIQDYQDLIKSDDEIKAIMDQIYGGQGGQQQPQEGQGLPPEMQQQMPQGMF